MPFYYAIFVVLLLLCVGRRETENLRLLAGCVLLFLIAAFRGPDIDADRQGYIEYYHSVLDSDFGNVEISFILLAKFVDAFLGNPIWLFVIYALMGIALKYEAATQLTERKTLSLLLYYCNFFLFWEMTQIRVAVAGGLMLLCVPQLMQRNYVRYGLLCAAAIFFHVEGLAILFLVALKGQGMNKWLYASIVPVFAVLAIVHLDVVHFATFIPIELVALKLGTYETYNDDSDKVFNVLFLARCAIAYFLLFNSERLGKLNPYFIPLLKIYFLGLAIYLALSSIPGLGARMGEFLFVVEFLLIPMMVDVFKERVFGYVTCVLIALGFLAFGLHYTKLLHPYSIARM